MNEVYDVLKLLPSRLTYRAVFNSSVVQNVQRTGTAGNAQTVEIRIVANIAKRIEGTKSRQLWMIQVM